MQGLDRVLSVQRPAVLAHIRVVRSMHPEATPADLVRTLERRYLLAVTGGGAGVGVVAALLGVAGGELLIPTLVLLFGVDIKLAGSLSLAVSLPTMVAAFARYSRDGSFAVLAREWPFVLAMALGSICGALVGGLLLGMVPGAALLPALAVILLLSAAKVWRHA